MFVSKPLLLQTTKATASASVSRIVLMGFRCENVIVGWYGRSMPVTSTNPFKWRHYEGGVILLCVAMVFAGTL